MKWASAHYNEDFLGLWILAIEEVQVFQMNCAPTPTLKSEALYFLLLAAFN